MFTITGYRLIFCIGASRDLLDIVNWACKSSSDIACRSVPVRRNNAESLYLIRMNIADPTYQAQRGTVLESSSGSSLLVLTSTTSIEHLYTQQGSVEVRFGMTSSSINDVHQAWTTDSSFE